MHEQTLLQVDISLTIYRNSRSLMFHKVGVLKWSQNSQEKTCAGVSKVALKLLYKYYPNNLSFWSTKNCNCFGRYIM